jgi:hypothetical protein
MRLSSSPTLLSSLTIDFVHARVLFVAVNTAFPLPLFLSEASSRVHTKRIKIVCRKKRRKKKMPDARSRTLKERETDRHASSTRLISRLATHSYRYLTSTIIIVVKINNTVDDYQNRRKICTSVTNRMCNEANSIRCGMCMIKKRGTGYFLFFLRQTNV